LIQTGKQDVTVITRPGSTNKAPEGNVTVKTVDFDNEAALVEALKGHQALIITMSVRAPRDTVIKVSRAANKAGVRYVFPNWFGHDPANQVV
jgi:saccharopine dehydrogenase-like NADP-dependent oxidoreductase